MPTDNIEALWEIAQAQEQAHGPHSLETAKAVRVLADAYSQIDDIVNAETIYQRACEIYALLGMSAEVEQIERQIQDLRCRVTSDIVMDEAALTLSSFNIPVFVRDGNNALGAEPQADISYAELSQSILLEDDDGGETVADRQQAAEQEGDGEKENPALEDAIFSARYQVAQLKQKGFTNTSQLADALVDLASLYAKKNRHDLMETLLLEALSIREKVYGKSHLSVSTDLKNLARVFFMTERFGLAAQALARGLQIRESQLGIYHPQVADMAEFYAKVLHKVGRSNEAKDFETRAADIRERHPSEWEDFRRAALRAVEKEDFFEAQAYWLAALDECIDLEKEDPRVLVTHENLAFVYWKRGKYDKAEPHCRKILDISEQLLGKEHFDVATAANNLALVNERQEKFAEAAVLYKHAMIIMEGALGTDHPDVVSVREAHDKVLQLAHKQLEQKLQKSGL